MNKIQQLIQNYPQSKKDIIHELQHRESLWLAYSPAAKNHYTDFYREIPTAYVFSEENFCDDYKKYLSKENINIETMKNSAEDRITLFSDFMRCGIEQVIVDNGRTFVTIALPDIINSPDFSSMPETERPLMNPALMLYTNIFFRETDAGYAENSIEQNMLKEIYNAKYLLPILPEGCRQENLAVKQFNTGTAVLNIPAIKLQAGSLCIPVFTDWIELSKLDTENVFIGNIIRFEDIEKICSCGETVAVNPLGFNLTIDKAAVASIKEGLQNKPEQPNAPKDKTEQDVNQNNSVQTVTQSSPEPSAENVHAEPAQPSEPKGFNIEFFELRSVPDAFIYKLIEQFDMTEGIRNAYLKGYKQNDRSGYLCIVDFEGTDPTAFQKIAQETTPLTNGIPLTFVKFDSPIGRTAAEGEYPFYQR